MNRKITAVDFDMTLAKTDYPAIICPINSIIKYMKRCKAEGNIIILWTCRHDKELAEAVEWCKIQGLEFDYVNENVPELIEEYGDCRKIYADEYVDDTAKNVIDIVFHDKFVSIFGDSEQELRGD